MTRTSLGVTRGTDTPLRADGGDDSTAAVFEILLLPVGRKPNGFVWVGVVNGDVDEGKTRRFISSCILMVATLPVTARSILWGRQGQAIGGGA